MLNDLLYALWFFVPAGIAIVVPVFARQWPVIRDWNTPMDFGRTFRGLRILGDNKTWRGVATAAVFGTLVFWVQQRLSAHLGGFSQFLVGVHYSSLPLITGALLSVGAMLGDAVKSFFKRQRGFKPGQSWFPFDQLDFIIGACVLASAVVVLPIHLYVWIAAVWFVIHILSNFTGYLLHINKNPI